VVDGFKLDHGFQIFLTSYPEVRPPQRIPARVSFDFRLSPNRMLLSCERPVLLPVMVARLVTWHRLFVMSQAREVLDYNKLDLKPFYAGALVFWDGGFHRVADPVRCAPNPLS
jgi:hypothetical protein